MIQQDATAEKWAILTKPVYNLDDLENIFGCHRATIWRVQKRGFLRKLPGFHATRVPRQEVIRFLEAEAKEEII